MAVFIVTAENPQEAMKVVDTLYEDNVNDLPSALSGAAALSTTLHTMFRDSPFTNVSLISGKDTKTAKTKMIKDVST